MIIISDSSDCRNIVADGEILEENTVCLLIPENSFDYPKLCIIGTYLEIEIPIRPPLPIDEKELSEKQRISLCYEELSFFDLMIDYFKCFEKRKEYANLITGLSDLHIGSEKTNEIINRLKTLSDYVTKQFRLYFEETEKLNFLLIKDSDYRVYFKKFHSNELYKKSDEEESPDNGSKKIPLENILKEFERYGFLTEYRGFYKLVGENKTTTNFATNVYSSKFADSFQNRQSLHSLFERLYGHEKMNEESFIKTFEGKRRKLLK